MTQDNEEKLHACHALDHIEIDDEGWMHGRDVGITKSVRDQALWTDETHVLGVVWHYTDTRSVGATGLARRIAGPVNGGRAASWHLVIDRGGIAVQSVSALRGSWHAGGSDAARFEWHSPLVHGHRVWSTMPPTRRKLPGANSLFFGIELENVGEVRINHDHGGEGEWLGWPFKRGAQRGAPVVVPSDEVQQMPPTNGVVWQGHHIYTQEQIETATRVTSALVDKYDLIRENCGLLHSQIDPNNRTDPGPLWVAELPRLLDRAFLVDP